MFQTACSLFVCINANQELYYLHQQTHSTVTNYYENVENEVLFFFSTGKLATALTLVLSSIFMAGYIRVTIALNPESDAELFSGKL